MNKFLIVAAKVVAVTFLSLISSISSFAHTNPSAMREYTPVVPPYSTELVKSRLDNLSGVIDIQYTAEVGRRIKEYTVDYRVAGEKILGLVDLYFPLFEEEISKRNIPQELKFVAVVESHLDITARSKSGAVGLWQFMKSTARQEGLQVTNHIDERKDAVKSTRAALEYLTDLHERFDDWTLAIAAYNCGPGGVNKAIRRSGSKKYWELRHYLPRETQKYVPRIIAAMYLMQYYHDHNLSARSVDNDLKLHISISDGKGHNLQRLSKELDLDYKILHTLNPQYINGQFPKNNNTLYLNVPLSRYEKYLELHAPTAYKLLLEERREEELLKLKEEQQRKLEELRKELISPLLTIRKIYYDKVIQQQHQRKKYKARYATTY